MTAKGDRAASGVQVITYIVIFEMIMQMYLLCKNTSHTLPLISAVHCRFYFNSKVYLQSEDSGSHRRKFQHRCLVCSDNRIPTPLSAVSSVMSKQSSPSSGRTTLRAQGELRVCSSVSLQEISFLKNPVVIHIIVINSFICVYSFGWIFRNESTSLWLFIIWPLCFCKMAIFSHNAQGILIGTKPLVLSGMWTKEKDCSWGHWPGYS